MIKLDAAIGLVSLALWIFCVVDVIQTPDVVMRNLSKTMWLIIVLLFPLVGSIAWLAAGRPENAPRRRPAHERATPHFPEYDRPGRAAATSPDDDDAFLASVRQRAEEQRRRYEQQKKQQREDD